MSMFSNVLQQESLGTGSDPSLTTPWPLQVGIGTSQSGHLTFGTPLDTHKLQEARMLINGMDFSRVTEQDEDGDT